MGIARTPVTRQFVNMHTTYIVVSYNNTQTLPALIRSAKRMSRCDAWDMIIVDNASPDGSADAVEALIATECMPNIRLIRNEKNRGFAHAVNQGIAEVSSDEHVMLVNPDVEFASDAVSHIEYALRRYGDGISGFKLTYPDGRPQITARAMPTFLNQVITVLHIVRLVERMVPSMYSDIADTESDSEVGHVMGSAMLIPASVRARIGALDPGFFIWFEEVDYCARAQAAGIPVRYVARKLGTHMVRYSFGQQSFGWRHLRYADSVCYYAYKHFSFPQRVGILLSVIPGNVISKLLLLFRS